MSIAPSSAWIWLALPWFAALGLALPSCVAARKAPGSRRERAQALALALAAGLLVNYALGLLLPQLRAVIAVSGLLIASHVAFVAFGPAAGGGVRAMFAIGWGRALLAAAALLVFAGAMLYEPLQAWDARSIWFFQAKRIYFDGGFRLPGQWANPAYLFSHLDYPKLLPLLAAEFAHVFGVWNEYIPKAALVALLAPVVVGLAGVGRGGRLAMVFLACVLLLGGKNLVWNGYMDAFSAMYGGLALLFLVRWLQVPTTLDLVSGIIFLGVGVGLKNEGLFFAVCIVAVVVPTAVRRLRGEVRTRPVVAGCEWLALAIALAGFAVWSASKMYWHVPNDLDLGLASLVRAEERARAGALVPIWRGLLWDGHLAPAAFILVVAAGLAKALRARLEPLLWVPAAVATLYALGLTLIYLSTPHDLAWHLKFSADRTALLAVAGLFGSCFLVLEAIETEPGERKAVQAGAT